MEFNIVVWSINTIPKVIRIKALQKYVGHDTFVVLPTGYSKSMSFAVLLLLFDVMLIKLYVTN